MTLRHSIAFAFLASFSFFILAFYQTFHLTTKSVEQFNRDDLPPNLFETSATTKQQLLAVDEADFIIQRAYAQTYARMADCEYNVIEKDCTQRIIDEFQKQQLDHNQQQEFSNANNNLQPLPWWFQTLLRDIPTNGAYGFWHHFSTSSTSPPIRFCAIGKNGSTEWRKVFKALNAPEFGGEENSKFNTKQILDEDTPQTVFLRDPLERLLSAYLDKCVKDDVRKTQGHCEPNGIFASEWMERRAAKAGKPIDEKEMILPPELPEIAQDSEKEKFAAYVDLFPLKWNVHFVPQAISCDLYRTIDDYDTYYMGKSFMSELHRMSTKYGGLLPDTLNTIFDYESQLDKTDSTERNVGADNRHGTQAPAKVAKYYSPRAVRRALEYLSIDYVTLGFEVPDWAREMLRNDNALR